jgi:hypothetical protein
MIQFKHETISDGLVKTIQICLYVMMIVDRFHLPFNKKRNQLTKVFKTRIENM